MANIDAAIALAESYAQLQFARSQAIFAQAVETAAAAAAGKPPQLPPTYPPGMAPEERVRALAAPGATVLGDGCAYNKSADGTLTMSTQLRRLLLVTKHKNKRGDLFAMLFSSEHERTKDRFGDRVFALEMDGVLRIVGITAACAACIASGQLAAGGRCTVCDGSGWKKKTGAWKIKEGINFAKPGAVLEVKKLSPPQLLEHRALYDCVEAVEPAPAVAPAVNDAPSQA